MLTLKEKLGLRIKSLRKMRGYSQEKLAEVINMDIPNLSNIERGKRFMTAETLEKLSNALNVTERELFDFSEVTPQKYIRPNIDNILNTLNEDELKFFLDILMSFQNYKG